MRICLKTDWVTQGTPSPYKPFWHLGRLQLQVGAVEARQDLKPQLLHLCTHKAGLWHKDADEARKRQDWEVSLRKTSKPTRKAVIPLFWCSGQCEGTRELSEPEV